MHVTERTCLLRWTLCCVLFSAAPLCAAEPVDMAPDYVDHIAPIFDNYCVGCHNADDREGKLSLESFADLQKGGGRGPAVLAGNHDASRLVRVLIGEAEPKMPPEDNEAPTPEEIELLRKWIEAGAKGPDGVEPDRRTLIVPEIVAAEGVRRAIGAVAYAPDGAVVAVARFREVELRDARSQRVIRTLADHPGKVNAVAFSNDGSLLFVATGVAGLYGEARVWNVADGTLVRTIAGHRDTMYAARPSLDGKILATAGYDRKIILWDLPTGESLRTLEGHNGAVYDLAFSADGNLLASASGDETVKIWHVATGTRLDTRGEPLDAQYAVAFSTDGRYLAAGGADNRIRIWQVVSRDRPQINPIVHARFAHEGAVVQLAFSRDGKTLVSVGEDRTIKAWETQTFTETRLYEPQSDVTQALAIAPSGKSFLVGRMDGSLGVYPIEQPALAAPSPQPVAVDRQPQISAADPATTMSKMVEEEPNDAAAEATLLSVPGTASGVIHATRPGQQNDADLFRFASRAGQKWIIEVNAARSKSPLDSRIEVLDAVGQPVLRVLLHAVRDSYLTFRPIDSRARSGRLHNWEEMELNEYVYINGEVVKLYLAPRGPDSDYDFYPQDGSRYCYFGTTATTHALNEPCYVVRPYPPGAKIVPNGLPVFPLYFENDDDGLRKLGSDSRLAFTAPADGSYFVRVSDARGFQGENYKYELTVRRPQPNFRLSIHGANPSVAAGSGREFHIKAERIDDFDGDIRVEITGIPPGFRVTTPLVIQAGHNVTYGAINALAIAPQPTPENAKSSKLTATATIDGKQVTKQVGTLGEIKLADKPRVLVSLLPSGEAPTQAAGQEAEQDAEPQIPTPPELTIAPGETVAVQLRIERNGLNDLVGFESIRLSLPHGVIIDNIGLNQVLIPAGQTERTMYLSAAKWVPETSRLFFMRGNVDGGQTSWPVMLHVRRRGK